MAPTSSKPPEALKFVAEQKPATTARASSKEQDASLLDPVQGMFDSKGQKAYLSNVLANDPNLVQITIPVKVTDDAMAAFKERADIQGLNLYGQSMLTDQCLKYIVHLPLHRLCLQNTRIDDQGLKEIAKMRSLEELDLSYTRISPAGLSYLKDLKHLHIISVSYGAGNDDGLANLGRMQSLQTIKIARAAITENGLLRLSALKDLNTLILYYDHALSARDIHAIGQCKALSKLSLEGTPIVDESAFGNLSTLHLTDLKLSDSKVTDKAFEIVSHFKDLTTLRCAGTKITNAGLKYLSGLHNLTEADLSRNVITDGALESIAKLPLSSLILSKTEITNSELQAASSMTQLNMLNLSGTRISGSGGISYLSKSQIVSLDLSGTEIDDTALAFVADMKNLKSLKITDCNLLTKKELAVLKEKRPALSIIDKNSQ
jgi:Leucine-rich repeat (LRR) protein